MQPAKAERFWATVGKIGVIVGVALGLVNLYRIMNPDGPRLACECNVAEIDSEVFRRISDAQLAEIIGPAPKNAPEDSHAKDAWASDTQAQKHSTKKPPTPREVAELIRSEFRDRWDLSSDQTVITCILRNTGSKEAKDTELVLPRNIDGGYFHANGGRQDIVGGADIHVIRLGSVRPGGAVEITAWSDAMFFYGLEGSLLTHSEGRGRVAVAHPVYGLLAMIEDDAWLLVVVSALMLVVGVVSALIGAHIRQRKVVAKTAAAPEKSTGITDAA